jgi:UDP-GlcNAc:undecaprenyl-phosphate/decaprenyl-phosphate GlcNAc-1-phosphate transferase
VAGSVLALLAFAAAVGCLCAGAGPIGQRLQVLDRPDGRRKTHARPTPLVGGIALMGPLVVATLGQAVLRPDEAGLLLALAAAGCAFLLVGLADDRHHLPAAPRLLVSFALALALMLAEPRLVLAALDFGPLLGELRLGPLAIPFTLLCVVGFQNAVNMADGRNGLVVALAVFWAVVLLVHAPAELTPVLALLLVGLLVVFPFNWRGRLFLGDAGSFSIGAVVALAMVHTYNRTDDLGALGPVLWLLIPVIDCLRLMAGRALAGRSPLAPDTDHLHHRLGRLWAWPKAFRAYLALAAAPGLLGLALPPAATFPLVLATLAAYGLVLHRTRPAA